MSEADDVFNEAEARVKTLPARPSNQELLELYGLFKQGTEGDVSGKRPGMLDMKGRFKFDAWAARQGMSMEAAKAAYVTLVKDLLAKAGKPWA